MTKILPHTEFFYTKKDLAMKLQMSEKTISRKIQLGDIKAIKIGRLVRISDSAVHEYFKRFNTVIDYPLL